jgi:hypothetical protein
VNAEPFEAMARSIPLNVVSKQRGQLQQLEALLMGQAGLLNGRYKEHYPRLLQKEYRYLKNKFQLKPVSMPVHFLRMRPGNFPTIRLAQLAALLYNSPHIFSKIRDVHDPVELREWLTVVANDYWHYHYRFDEESAFRVKKIGDSMIDEVLINTVCPILFSYGRQQGEQAYCDRALSWLAKIHAEDNSITNGFKSVGIHCASAFDSQALLELKSSYCNEKKCLDCAIGNSLLKGVIAGRS